MTEKDLFELAPLYAVGALDGAELVAFEKALPTNPSLQAEVRSFERTIEHLAGSELVLPSATTRERVLASVGRARASRPSTHFSTSLPALAATLTVGLGLVAVQLATSRGAAVARAERAEARLVSLAEANADLRRHLDRAELRASELALISRLLSSPSTSVLKLGPTVPSTGWGNVILNTASEDAALVISGLGPAPSGKVYQAWILSGDAPIPAGTFTVEDPVRLVWLKGKKPEMRVQGVAISVEPMGGVPAPTGAIVLVTKS